MTPKKTLNMISNIYHRLLAAAVVAALLAGCSAASKEENNKERLEKLKKEQADMAKEIQKLEADIAKENPESEANVKAREVSVTELVPKRFDHYIQTQGHVESENNIIVSARSAGLITNVAVTEGQQVKKGQMIAEIDNTMILRNIESMEAQLALVNSVYERQKNLWDQKIGTEIQFLQAKTNKESLEKQLASLKEQNEMTRIRAPFNGTVDEINIKVGENIAPGMPAARIVNTSDLKLVVRISEAYVTSVKKGNKAIVHIPDISKDIEGTVSFVGRNIDVLSRTFNIEVKLPSDLTYLRPNMTATAKVIFNSDPSALVVPVNIIQDINNEKVIYIAGSAGKYSVARREVVTVEGVYGGFAQVKGLSAGDKVITVGYQGLNDGDFIKI